MQFVGKLFRSAQNISSFNTIIRNYNVTVLGAANEVGQTLSLLLKTHPSITKLTLHDNLEITPGVAMDVSHIPTEAAVKAYAGSHDLAQAIEGSDIILVTGGISKMPGVPKSSLFQTNADYIHFVCSNMGRIPMPFVGIATEPINVMVPMAAEVLRNQGQYDPRKLFGITAMDALRARAMYALEYNMNPNACYVPVIGGHSDRTMIPLLSKTTPAYETDEKKQKVFINKILRAEDQITLRKRGWGPSLSIAHSAFLFAQTVIQALDGYPMRLHAFVENNDFGTSYFGGLVQLNMNGAGEIERYTNLSPYEFELLETSIVELRKDVDRGRRMIELA